MESSYSLGNDIKEGGGITDEVSSFLKKWVGGYPIIVSAIIVVMIIVIIWMMMKGEGFMPTATMKWQKVPLSGSEALDASSTDPNVAAAVATANGIAASQAASGSTSSAPIVVVPTSATGTSAPVVVMPNSPSSPSSAASSANMGSFTYNASAAVTDPTSLSYQVLHSSDYNCANRVPVGDDAWSWMTNQAQESFSAKVRPKSENQLTQILAGH